MGLFRVACVLALVAGAAVPAWADEPPTGIPTPSIASSFPQELADPGGIRSALARRGITFGVNYIGEVLGKEAIDAPKALRLIVGNPVIMKAMVKHVPDAASYAPVNSN